MDEDERLRIFNAEHDKIYSTTPPDILQKQGTPGQASNVNPQEQAALREIEANIKANNPSAVINQPAVAPIATTAPAHAYTPPIEGVVGNVCHECGTMHPPVLAGQKCPNAKLNLPTISDEEIGNFLVSMRNILISQIEKNQVKNAKKLFQQSTVALAQFLEGYKEDKNE